jgi:hypothetical protein
VYALLAVYNEALRIRHERTRDPRFLVPNAAERALYWEELLWLRHNKHLPWPRGDGGQHALLQVQHRPSGTACRPRSGRPWH